MQIFKKLNTIFTRRQKSRIAIIIVAILIGATLETISISLISPLVSLITSSGNITDNSIFSIINEVFSFQRTESLLIFICSSIAFIYIFKSFYTYNLYKIQYGYMYNLEAELRKSLFIGYLEMPYTFHAKKNPATIFQTITQDTAKFNQFIQAIMFLVSEGITSLFILGLLFFISPFITLGMAGIFAVCILLFFFVLKKKSVKAGAECRESSEMMFKDINQSLGGIKELKAFNREGYFVEEFKKHNSSFRSASVQSTLWGQVPRLMIEGLSFGGIMIIMALAIAFGADINQILPQLAAFALAAFRLLPSINRGISTLNNIFYAKSSVDAIANDLNEISSADRKLFLEPPLMETVNLDGDILFDNLTFTYPGTETPVLQNVSFLIPKSKAIAFIGSSGAGKTTIADLLLGVLVPNSGTVTSCGVSVHQNLRGWSKHVGYIPQQIHLLDTTITSNVAFGIPKDQIDISRVWDALKKAQVDEFICTLEHGLDTTIGDRGIRLSGGQRQRLGIARALYHNPDVLILDEATSALDNETEQAVMDAIQSLHGEKTLVIIAHRLSTIEYCDIVYTVGNGNVVKSKE